MFQLRQIRPKISDLTAQGTTKPKLSFKGQEIAFEDVSFSYPSNSQRQILQNLNLRIPLQPLHTDSADQLSRGNKIAIVGSSGSGKSTIYRLLYRFYDINGGAIKIDGQDIRDVTLHSLREQIAVVPQDILLFNDTIEYNLRYGNLITASDEKIKEILKLVRLEEFISRLPQGLKTVVGERGLKLSGGEKQRVAIARCLLKDSPVVILDEATSALDTETEQAIQQSLQVLNQTKRTLIVIAHRLSTIEDADCIFVLEKGQVVEQGKHNELLARPDGRYHELVTKMKSNHSNIFPSSPDESQ